MHYHKMIGTVAATLIELALAIGGEPADGPDYPKRGSTPVLFLTVGASSPHEEDRKLGWGLTRAGWYNSVIDKRIEGWAEEFKKRDLPFRVMFHNPYGTNNREPMDFDQAVEAAENPRTRLPAATFGPWLETRVKPLIEGGGECIIYLGSGRRDPDIVALKDQPAAWLRRVTDSVDDLPDWCSLAFDDVANLEHGDPMVEFMALHRRFRRVYIEPRPLAAGPLAEARYPIVITAHLWPRSDPERHRDAVHMIRNDQAGDEILRLSVSGNKDRVRRELQQAVNDGHTILFGYTDFWALDLRPERITPPPRE